jgi:hypothetical protein
MASLNSARRAKGLLVLLGLLAACCHARAADEVTVDDLNGVKIEATLDREVRSRLKDSDKVIKGISHWEISISIGGGGELHVTRVRTWISGGVQRASETDRYSGKIGDTKEREGRYRQFSLKDNTLTELATYTVGGSRISIAFDSNLTTCFITYALAKEEGAGDSLMRGIGTNGNDVYVLSSRQVGSACRVTR